MQKLFNTLSIKDITLKNRIVFAPTTMGSESLEFIQKLVDGNVGLIILPDVSVVASMLGMPSLDTLKWAPYFEQVLSIAHAKQCLVSVQLFHPEYDVEYITALYNRRHEISREEIHRQIAESTNTYVDLLTVEKIKELEEKYIVAIRNAQQIGFDMVQIHGDRLIGSFTSSIFNHRKDAYGELSFFFCQLVQRIREEFPKIVIDYKAVIRTEHPNLGKGGTLLEDVPEFIPKLEKSGVDMFHVALANHTSISDTIPAASHKDLKGEGCFLHLARAVKSVTTLPVCAVGKLQHPDFIDDVLNEGFDLVGLSRQLVADPYWGKKVMENRCNDIVYCTYCNAKCVTSIMTGKTVSCILHDKKSNS